jgi:polyferredoxin
VDCGACVRACPTGIDIRDGLQMECIACAACVDACRPIMAKLGRAPHLVGYAFGEPGTLPRLARPGVVALAAATALSLALTVAVVAGRGAVSLHAIPEAAFAPRRTTDGRALNAYTVALENHGRAPVTVALSVVAAGPGAEVTVRPERVLLAAGERRQVRVLATARGLAPGQARASLVGEVRAAEGVLERREAALPLVVPEVP